MGTGDGAAPVMRIVDDRAFFDRLGADGLIGFGESFMAGEWDADDPAAVLEPLAARIRRSSPRGCNACATSTCRTSPAQHENTVAGARRNIERHYDLSNDLFALFLDESMTYSSALFEPTATTLRRGPAAQDRPAARRGAGRPGHARARDRHRLGRARDPCRAARRPRHVAHAVARATGPGPPAGRRRRGVRPRRRRAPRLPRRARHLRRGRERRDDRGGRASATGRPTSPPSIGCCAPDGQVGIQAIVLEHDRMLAHPRPVHVDPKYIFPGGALPSVRAIDENVREHTKLRIHRAVRVRRQLRADAAPVARALRRPRRRGRGSRLRRAVPADVGLLSRLLRGRVRDRLPRRRAAGARPGGTKR